MIDAEKLLSGHPAFSTRRVDGFHRLHGLNYLVGIEALGLLDTLYYGVRAVKNRDVRCLKWALGPALDERAILFHYNRHLGALHVGAHVK